MHEALGGKAHDMKLKLAAAAVLTVMAGLAFANNLSVIWFWWSGFLAAGGDSAGLAEGVRGVIPWLDWCAVDHSAATTFIPFWGMMRVTRGLWQIVKKEPVQAAAFPFTAYTDKMNVALGLFGTLWGIIVIGFYDLETVTMADLMQCLHTALFSTLTAVVWVYMVDHPLIRPAMRRWLLAEGRASAEKSDLMAAVEMLTARMHEASDEVRRMAEEARGAMEAERARHRAAMKEMKELWEADRARAAKESEERAERMRRAAEEERARHERATGELEARAKAETERHARAEKELEERMLRVEKDLEERYRKTVEKLEAAHGRERAELEKKNEAAARRMEAVRKALGGE